jgi:hypothetical protein
LTDCITAMLTLLIAQVLHTPLFWLLPWSVKRRLQATWFQFFAAGKARAKARATGKPISSGKPGSRRDEDVTDAGAVSVSDSDRDVTNKLAAEGESKGRSRVRRWAGKAARPTAAGPLAEGHEGGGSGGTGGHDDANRSHQGQSAGCLIGQPQQMQQQQDAASAARSPDAVAIPILLDTAAVTPQQQGLLVQSGGSDGLRHRSAANPPAGSSSSSNARHAVLVTPLAQQQQQQDAACSAGVLPLVGGSALDVALRAQQAQGVSAGVGGVGVFSDEWRRAARAMAGGLTLQVRR